MWESNVSRLKLLSICKGDPFESNVSSIKSQTAFSSKTWHALVSGKCLLHERKAKHETINLMHVLCWMLIVCSVYSVVSPAHQVHPVSFVFTSLAAYITFSYCYSLSVDRNNERWEVLGKLWTSFFIRFWAVICSMAEEEKNELSKRFLLRRRRLILFATFYVVLSKHMPWIINQQQHS